MTPQKTSRLLAFATSACAWGILCYFVASALVPLAFHPLKTVAKPQAGELAAEPNPKHVLAALGSNESSLPNPAAKALPAASPSLSLLGVAFTEDGRGVALFAEQGKAPQAYHRGARLPQGETIESISTDKVVVSSGGTLSEFAAPQRPPTLAIAPPQSLPPLPKSH